MPSESVPTVCPSSRSRTAVTGWSRARSRGLGSRRSAGRAAKEGRAAKMADRRAADAVEGGGQRRAAARKGDGADSDDAGSQDSVGGRHVGYDSGEELDYLRVQLSFGLRERGGAAESAAQKGASAVQNHRQSNGSGPGPHARGDGSEGDSMSDEEQAWGGHSSSDDEDATPARQEPRAKSQQRAASQRGSQRSRRGMWARPALPPGGKRRGAEAAAPDPLL